MGYKRSFKEEFDESPSAMWRRQVDERRQAEDDADDQAAEDAKDKLDKEEKQQTEQIRKELKDKEHAIDRGAVERKRDKNGRFASMTGKGFGRFEDPYYVLSDMYQILSEDGVDTSDKDLQDFCEQLDDMIAEAPKNSSFLGWLTKTADTLTQVLDTDDIDEAKDLIWSATLSLEKAMNSVDNSKSLKNRLTSNQKRAMRRAAKRAIAKNIKVTTGYTSDKQLTDDAEDARTNLESAAKILHDFLDSVVFSSRDMMVAQDQAACETLAKRAIDSLNVLEKNCSTLFDWLEQW